MNRDFYATMAQVLPVLLLGMVWEANYLQRLRARSRAGVWFWTKPRLRIFLLFVAVVLLSGIAVSLLVLAGALADRRGCGACW